MTLRNNWNLPDRPELGAMNVVNSLIRGIDFADVDALPSLRDASSILMGSDYSGQHAGSQYEAFGFVLVNANRAMDWIEARELLRAKILHDGRRISYKALNDRKRNVALAQFLDAANLLSGLLAVVLVDKSIESLFQSSGRLSSADTEIESFSHWSPRTVERLLRTCHFASLFVAGLSKEHQNVLWVTDQDDIAANDARLGELTSAYGNICSHYLPHMLGHLRVATTASDTGNRDLEDLVALPDLAAGAVCEALNAYRRDNLRPVPGVILPVPEGTSAKARKVMGWFSASGSSLKRLVIAFEPIVGTSRMRVRHYSFVGSTLMIA